MLKQIGLLNTFLILFDVLLNNRTNRVTTPSGYVVPKYALWMTFPTVRGTILKSRMYLMDKLPFDVLADINMLKAFGYQFKDETPPVFRHDEQRDIDFDLERQDEKESKELSSVTANWYNKHRRNKLNHLRYANNYAAVNASQETSFYDSSFI